MSVPLLLVLLGLAVAAVALGGVRGEDKPTPIPGGGWSDRDAPRRIRKLAKRIEDATGWIGLGDFLVAVAWTESRGNPSALNPEVSSNAGRGWFGMRPKSAKHDAVLMNPDLLLEEEWAVAMAAWYAERLRSYWRHDGEPTWLALRRGWALPSLVGDRDEDRQRSRDVRRRLEDAVAKAGLPDSFMYEEAFPPGYAWPGIDNILRIVQGERTA